MDATHFDRARAPRWLAFVALLGLYLTARGYHSRDNDQAYRLPLLLHRQDPRLFADDPFVRAFDAFNPHGGFLALLDAASRPLGLSAALAGLFALTFLATGRGLDRLARAAWPGEGPKVGLAAFGLVLATKAGNIGTNHLFEAMLLDRLMALALGWNALAAAIGRPGSGRWTAPALLAAAGWIHPALGLQLSMLLAACWLGWGLCPGFSGVPRRVAATGVAAAAAGMLPVLLTTASQSSALLDGLPTEEFRLLSAYVQSPQHMIPHLWRASQWLAWACFPVLALVALSPAGGEPAPPEEPGASRRLAIALGVTLLGLAAAWFAVEVVRDLRCTLFQPFRMATVARGLALVAVSGHVARLWRSGGDVGKARAVLLFAGLTGDLAMVVATAVELAAEFGGRLGRRGAWIGGALALLAGLGYLARHDTESGYVPLLASLAGLAVLGPIARRRAWSWTPSRASAALAMAWAVPLAALLATAAPSLAPRLVERCRFAALPTDDVERLAVWCRAHTPASSRFIGPPGPKTFRLWSRRSVVFNRASGPYHAAGLADWADRFRDHVGFRGTTAAFARAYLEDRQALERRYDRMTDAARAALARRYGATHVLAAAPGPGREDGGPLELLRVEGRYAVYRLRAPTTPLAAASGVGAEDLRPGPVSRHRPGRGSP